MQLGDEKNHRRVNLFFHFVLFSFTAFLLFSWRLCLHMPTSAAKIWLLAYLPAQNFLLYLLGIEPILERSDSFRKDWLSLQLLVTWALPISIFLSLGMVIGSSMDMWPALSSEICPWKGTHFPEVMKWTGWWPEISDDHVVVHRCHRLHVCTPGKFVCWKPKPQSDGIWRWDFGELIRSWRWTVISGINALIRRERTTPAQPLSLFLLVFLLSREETLGRHLCVLSCSVVSYALQSCGL